VGFLFANVPGPGDAVRYLSGTHPGHMATLGEYLLLVGELRRARPGA
jgi:hypothetical protein